MKQVLPIGYSEKWYLILNPGVAQAVEKGHFESGAQHYLLYGFKERRRYKKPKLYKMNSYFKKKKTKNNIMIEGKDNIIEYESASLESTRIKITGNNNKILLKGGAEIKNCTIDVQGDNHLLEIGYFSSINNSLIGFEDSNCKIKIGDNTTIFGDCVFASVEPDSIIEIGDDCMFSIAIDLRTSDSHSIIDLETNKRINYGDNIKIGNHVWIGAYAKILKGVTIQDCTIIAMSSIVTKKFAVGNCVIGGSPAKVLKRNVNWSRERIYDN